MRIRRLIVVLGLSAGAVFAASFITDNKLPSSPRVARSSAQARKPSPPRSTMSFEERLAIMCKEGGSNWQPVQMLMQPQGRALVREWAAGDVDGFLRFLVTQQNGTNYLVMRGGLLLDMMLGVKDGQGWSAALKHADSLPYKPAYGDWEARIKFLKVLVEEDVDAAARLVTEYATQNPGNYPQDWSFLASATAVKLVEEAHARGNLREGLDAALQWIRALPPDRSPFSGLVLTASHGVAEPWVRLDFEGAKWALDQGLIGSNDPLHRPLTLHLAGAMTKNGSAFEGFQHALQEEALGILFHAATEAMNTNPAATIPKLLAMATNAVQTQLVVRAVARTLPARNMSFARQWLIGLSNHQPPASVNRAAAEIMLGLPGRDTNEFGVSVAFIGSLPEGPIREACRAKFVKDFSATHGYGFTYARSNEFAEKWTRTAAQLAEWDQLAAWQFVSSLDRYYIPKNLAEWREQVRQQVEDWLKSAPPGSARDAAIEAHFRFLTITNKSELLEVVASVSDPLARDRIDLYMNPYRDAP